MGLGELLRDYPNALRIRADGFRAPRVPTGWPDGDRLPVVLIPGIYESWHFLRGIGAALHDDGHPVHVVASIGRNARPIPWVAAQVRALMDARDLRDAVIVGHSKGGIVGKHLLVEELGVAEAERRIRHLVAIASPFAGSSMARLAPVGGLRAFLPGDVLLARLAAERAVDARITSVYPRVDPHIPEGSRRVGAENVEIDTTGHFGVLRDPRTIAAVRRAVARA
jgi:pimeloyl-ACP methyl ester carboxylesterase